MLPDLLCPRCHTPITSESAFDCAGCGTHYGRTDGYWDLAPWLEYEDVDAPAHGEERGERRRTEQFYLPLLQALADHTGRQLGDLSALDDGCGWGVSVERLGELGVNASGLDVGYRRSAWAGRAQPGQYLRADGRSLPFADATFDAIFSFGVIEHVGIEGESGASEEVAVDYQAQRARYVSEAIRTVRAPGIVVLAQPNGACPVDFWHYSGAVPMRFHKPDQPFLPRYEELAEWAHAAHPGVRVSTLSPNRILGMERISAWGPGRAGSGLVRAWLEALSRPRLARARRSAFNPFLVMVFEKTG